jgi:mitogen-activated protein kinase kinase kinase 7
VPGNNKELEREISALIKIRAHPNLVSFFGVCLNEDDAYLVMEFCNGGSLHDWLHKKIPNYALVEAKAENDT